MDFKKKTLTDFKKMVLKKLDFKEIDFKETHFLKIHIHGFLKNAF